jgi:hypothetical protein
LPAFSRQNAQWQALSSFHFCNAATLGRNWHMVSLSKSENRFPDAPAMEAPSRGLSWPRIAAAAVLAVGCAASLVLNWPGQLSYDSVVQLHDGRLGHYNPWHPPVMAWMLGVLDALLPGTGLFILFDTVLFFASIGSLLWLSRRPSWVSVVVATVCAALPQVVLYQGIVWKDVLFADSGVAGFVSLAHAAQHWQQRRSSLFVVAAFSCFILATLARQNGFVVLLFGLLALVFVSKRQGARWPRSFGLGIGTAAAAAVCLLAVNLLLATRTEDAWNAPAQIRLLQLYDLVGEVKTDPAIALETLSRANRPLVRLIRSDGTRLYTPVRNDTLIADSQLLHAFAATEPAVVASQWLDVMVRHPRDYLRVRTQVFRWVFLTPDVRQCMPYITGVTGPPQYLKELGVGRPFRPQDAALGNYAALFLPTPFYAHAAYAGLALILVVFLGWRRRPADVVIATMLVGAVVFTSGFFVISIACDYRYLLFLDLSALVALFYSAVGSRD